MSIPLTWAVGTSDSLRRTTPRFLPAGRHPMPILLRPGGATRRTRMTGVTKPGTRLEADEYHLDGGHAQDENGEADDLEGPVGHRQEEDAHADHRAHIGVDGLGLRMVQLFMRVGIPAVKSAAMAAQRASVPSRVTNQVTVPTTEMAPQA